MRINERSRLWCWWFVVFASGCVLRPAELDAGAGETGEPIYGGECLAGSSLEGVASTDDEYGPPCDVACGEGWGHGGDTLEIAWTVNVGAGLTGLVPGELTGVGGLVARPEGGMLMIATTEAASHLIAVDLDGTIAWAKPLPVELAGWGDLLGMRGDGQGRIYITQSKTAEIAALDLDGQFEWSVMLPGGGLSHLGATDAGVAVLVDLDPSSRELVYVSHAGEPLWSIPQPNGRIGFAASPDGTIAVSTAELINFYDADGGLMASFDQNAEILIWGASFVGEQTVAQFGGTLPQSPFGLYDNAWIELRGLDEVLWSRTYERATHWCVEEAGTLSWKGDIFLDVIALPDASLIITGLELFNGDVGSSRQPWIGHVSAKGELLASDRGLWQGLPGSAAAATDGSLMILLTESEPDPEPDPSQFFLRRYLP